ncbi:MAG TPA: hypothetical protein VL918_10755 [Sphingobium sp.]|nr:hypothetical protein [Sphingobium sp.]
MIPTSHDYYACRAREHRNLASTARPELQRIHERLAEVYTLLAKIRRLRQPRLRRGIAMPGTSE